MYLKTFQSELTHIYATQASLIRGPHLNTGHNHFFISVQKYQPFDEIHVAVSEKLIVAQGIRALTNLHGCTKEMTSREPVSWVEYYFDSTRISHYI